MFRGTSSEEEQLKGEGEKEVIKESAKEEEKSKQKLHTLLKRSELRVFSMNTVFPFDLFPDTLTVDENKVNLTFREFFASEVKNSIAIKDISTVTVESGFFLSTMKFLLVHPNQEENVIKMGPFKRMEAERAKRIILGLSICIKEGVEVSKINDQDLVRKIEELGTTTKR